MSDRFLREYYGSSAASSAESGGDAAAVHLTIATLDLDRALSSLLSAPRMTKRWIARRSADTHRIILVVYLTARHEAQIWTAARQMQQKLKGGGVPVYDLGVTDAEDWAVSIAEPLRA